MSPTDMHASASGRGQSSRRFLRSLCLHPRHLRSSQPGPAAGVAISSQHGPATGAVRHGKTPTGRKTTGKRHRKRHWKPHGKNLPIGQKGTPGTGPPSGAKLETPTPEHPLEAAGVPQARLSYLRGAFSDRASSKLSDRATLLVLSSVDVLPPRHTSCAPSVCALALLGAEFVRFGLLVKRLCITCSQNNHCPPVHGPERSRSFI